MTRMAATRDGYGQALLELAENEKVVVLEADLGKSTKSLHFRKQYPDRTVSCGIGEQNMLLVGAGLASSGYIPFASTFANRMFEMGYDNFEIETSLEESLDSKLNAAIKKINSRIFHRCA